MAVKQQRGARLNSERTKMYIAVDPMGTKWLVLGRALSASRRVFAARLTTFQYWKTLLLTADILALFIVLRWIALNYSASTTSLTPFPFISVLLVAVCGWMVRFQFVSDIKTVTTEPAGIQLHLHLLLLALIILSAAFQIFIFAMHVAG